MNYADFYLMGNVMVQEDLGRNDMSRTEAMYKIQDINPMLERNQDKYQLDRCILTKSHADGKIKRRNLKAKDTTTERTSITYK